MKSDIERDQWEQFDQKQIRALQLEKLKALLHHVNKTNVFYSALWKQHDVDISKINSLEDFAAYVPTVEKRDFTSDQQNEPPYGSRLRHLRDAQEPIMLYTTSGTTGQGQELHAQTFPELAQSSQVYSYMYKWAGIKPGDTALLTLPLTMLGGGRLEYHGAIDYGLNVLPGGNYDAGRKIDLIKRFKPSALIGTTSYFWHLAAISDQSPGSLGVNTLFCGGEGASLGWYDRLEKQWDARAFDRYGSAQSRNDHMFTCEERAGADTRPGMLHNIDTHVLLEVVDPETGIPVRDGERGEVVLTSLYHLDTPVIRCRMKDLAVYHDGSYCGCGRPFCGIEIGSISRLDEMYRIKGINVWPQAIEQSIMAFPDIDEYEVELSSSADGSDIAELRFMAGREIDDEEAGELCNRIAEEIRRKIALRFQVRCLPPGSLSRSDYKAKRWCDNRVHISDASRRG